MKADHLQAGDAAEATALNHLKCKGLHLVEKNHTCRFGEIDLIMLDGNDLVFIEVRYRKNQSFGGPLESITAKKQNKIKKTAESFLQKHPKLQFDQCRFDVMAISNKYGQPDIDWIQHAF